MIFDSIKDLENLKDIKCNYNEIENLESQKKIFDILLENKKKNKNLKSVSLKGNEIDKDLFEYYEKKMKENIIEFEAYSDEELEAENYEELPEDENGNLRIKG